MGGIGRVIRSSPGSLGRSNKHLIPARDHQASEQAAARSSCLSGKEGAAQPRLTRVDCKSKRTCCGWSTQASFFLRLFFCLFLFLFSPPRQREGSAFLGTFWGWRRFLYIIIVGPSLVIFGLWASSGGLFVVCFRHRDYAVYYAVYEHDGNWEGDLGYLGRAGSWASTRKEIGEKRKIPPWF